MLKLLSTCLVGSFLIGCASEPKSPEWIHQPTRAVDGGYIVYVGTGTASNAERAQFIAEGLALEDLANECSMIPKGTRLEDRYVLKETHETTAYVKVALEFQECDSARKTLDPTEIKKVANLGFTEQLKKYQDLMETGEMPDKGEVAQIEPPAEVGPAPVRVAGWSDSTHFYVVRQYVAYQKEVVILSPPTAYTAGSPQAQKFIAQVQPTAQQVQGIEEKSPALRKQAWSRVPERPHIDRPASLAPRSRIVRSSSSEVHPPAEVKPGGGTAHRGKGRRRGHRRSSY